MFSLCCSQTLLCIPVLVHVCFLVEGGAWEGGEGGRGGREGGRKGREGRKGRRRGGKERNHFLLSFDSLETLVGEPFFVSLVETLEVLQCHRTLLRATTLLQSLITHLKGGGEGMEETIKYFSILSSFLSAFLSFYPSPHSPHCHLFLRLLPSLPSSLPLPSLSHLLP